MMAYEYYEGEDIPKCNIKDFTTIYFYKGGVCIATNKDDRSKADYACKEVYEDQVGYMSAVKKYHDAIEERRKRFISDMYVYYRVDGNPRRALLLDKVTSILGEDGSFKNIFEAYGKLVELIRY